jgi:hypothetical protein
MIFEFLKIADRRSGGSATADAATPPQRPAASAGGTDFI